MEGVWTTLWRGLYTFKAREFIREKAVGANREWRSLQLQFFSFSASANTPGETSVRVKAGGRHQTKFCLASLLGDLAGNSGFNDGKRDFLSAPVLFHITEFSERNPVLPGSGKPFSRTQILLHVRE